jgi:hypothetical protein
VTGTPAILAAFPGCKSPLVFLPAGTAVRIISISRPAQVRRAKRSGVFTSRVPHRGPGLPAGRTFRRPGSNQSAKKENKNIFFDYGVNFSERSTAGKQMDQASH